MVSEKVSEKLPDTKLVLSAHQIEGSLVCFSAGLTK